jgi:hypothetical protein
MKTVIAQLLALTLLLVLTGCQTVVRENIISTINTGFGATLAENPQTQLYEVKVGYIRSQFYSIPTSKQVKGGKHTNEEGNDVIAEGQLSNDPSGTPELVSGIRMESDAKTLNLGVKISENFAVGKEAVKSPAAVAMYASMAQTAAGAKAAASGAAAVADSPDFTSFKEREAEKKSSEGEIRKVWRTTTESAQQEILDKAIDLEVVETGTEKKAFLKRLSSFADDTSDENLSKLKTLADFAKTKSK